MLKNSWLMVSLSVLHNTIRKQIHSRTIWGF